MSCVHNAQKTFHSCCFSYITLTNSKMDLIKAYSTPHGTLQIQTPHLFKNTPNAQNWLPLNNGKINTKNVFNELTFCQFFFNNETRKLTLICTFWKICFSSILQFPTATPIQRTFLSWNFTIAFVSLTFDSKDSWWVTSVGNLPAFTSSMI